ncbi:MAG TPA: hypothetical protein VMX38_01635 [Verrucomicrobiae bacterium]|jgi:hypothetical protein|nr:hypothetical protein [Verrucomicrobiae bacterium]
MFYLGLCLFVQLYLIFGISGLIWPEKLMNVYGVLMFPWSPSHQAIRANGIIALLAYLLVVGKLFVVGF